MREPGLLPLVAMLAPVREASDLPDWFAGAPERARGAWARDNR